MSDLAISAKSSKGRRIFGLAIGRAVSGHPGGYNLQPVGRGCCRVGIVGSELMSHLY